jgi:hypothetical protein
VKERALAAEDRGASRARWALGLQGVDVASTVEPFAAIISCTADREKVDKRTRSKWSRVLRYAAKYKTSAEPLATFVQRNGDINECAARFTRCPGDAVETERRTLSGVYAPTGRRTGSIRSARMARSAAAWAKKFGERAKQSKKPKTRSIASRINIRSLSSMDWGTRFEFS